VTFTVMANDACGSVTSLVSVPASGAAFPVGVTTVTNTATDNNGNTSTCTFTVTSARPSGSDNHLSGRCDGQCGCRNVLCERAWCWEVPQSATFALR